MYYSLDFIKRISQHANQAEFCVTRDVDLKFCLCDGGHFVDLMRKDLLDYPSLCCQVNINMLLVQSWLIRPLGPMSTHKPANIECDKNMTNSTVCMSFSFGTASM